LGDNNKIELREIKSGATEWIHLAQDRDQWQVLLNTIMNIWVPLNFWNILQ
jgi:hypothetical protein